MLGDCDDVTETLDEPVSVGDCDDVSLGLGDWLALELGVWLYV